jgi:hypothetical protein
MIEDNSADFSLAKLAAGLVGSVVSLKFIQGTYIERGLMCLGGSALSFYGTTPANVWVGIPNAEGLIGFMIGLFGMAIVAKCYEVVQVLDARQIAGVIWEWLKRKWGA